MRTSSHIRINISDPRSSVLSTTSGRPSAKRFRRSKSNPRRSKTTRIAKRHAVFEVEAKGEYDEDTLLVWYPRVITL